MPIFKGSQVIKYYVMFAFLFVQTVDVLSSVKAIDDVRKTCLSPKCSKAIISLWFSVLRFVSYSFSVNQTGSNDHQPEQQEP